MTADETLRKAANLMRERARAATPGPWSADGLEGTLSSPTGDVLHVQMWRESDAEHIASWHPVVALAVADWLDDAAAYVAAYPGYTHAEDTPLRVARAYLGESG